MLFENAKIKAYKFSSQKFIDKATVILEKKEILLNQTSYDKSEKIINKSGF